MQSNISQFPRQTISDSKKIPSKNGEPSKWSKECIDSAETFLSFDNTKIRQSFQNKKSNYDLYNGKLNIKEIEKLCNIHQLDMKDFPVEPRHIGMGNNKINLLVGEELKRNFDIRVVISSADQMGISSKEDAMKEKIFGFVQQQIQNGNSDPEKIQRDLQKFQHYMKYSWQDIKEVVATKLLMYETRKLDIKDKFAECFKDILIGGEELACIEEIAGEPSFRKVNSLNLYTIGSSFTNRLEDCDVIVECNYHSVGQVIDDYNEFLTEPQIKNLENGEEGSHRGWGLIQMKNRDLDFFDRFGQEPGEVGIYKPSSDGINTFGGKFDSDGNVRVIKVCWRSRRKLGKLKYFDEFGDEQKDVVDEYYKIDKSKGEEVKWFWVNEWWEGTKIGEDIYVKVRPVPYPGKSLTNYSKGTPPYVGTFANTNQGRVQSMMDTIKPLDYSFDLMYWKRELEIAAHHGNILAFNISMVPSGWDPEIWMKYVVRNKFMPLDPTNEILKGPSQGKSAGSFNQLTAQNIPFDTSHSIQMYTEMLADIEDKLGKISGVSPQREAQVSSKETVGGTERAVVQSSHITEYWFMLHNNFKKRCLAKLLEVSKWCYKENPIKAQYVLDDMGVEMLQSMDEIAEVEYDIHISNSAKDAELFQAIKQLTHAAMQTGQATLADVISIYNTDSVQAIAKKLESAQERLQQQEMEKIEKQKEIAAQQAEAEKEKEERKYQHEEYIKEGDHQISREEMQNKITLKEMELDGKFTEGSLRGDYDLDNNGIRDTIDIERTNIQRDKQIADDKNKEKDLSLKEKIHRDKMKMEDKKIKAQRAQKAIRK